MTQQQHWTHPAYQGAGNIGNNGAIVRNRQQAPYVIQQASPVNDARPSTSSGRPPMPPQARTPTKVVVGGMMSRAAPQCSSFRPAVVAGASSSLAVAAAAGGAGANRAAASSPTSVAGFDRHASGRSRFPLNANTGSYQGVYCHSVTSSSHSGNAHPPPPPPPYSNNASYNNNINNNAPPQSSSSNMAAAENNKKYKTEMCRNVLETGYCRFGHNCHYAHSEEERMAPSAEDLTRDDRLLLPCGIMVATGFCPYDHRCKSLHDPRVTSYPALVDEQFDEFGNPTNNGGGTIVLEHCTKAKRSGDAIPDRLYHRRLNSVRQVNPLVAPCVWEKCRPSRIVGGVGMADAVLEFRATYDLVCNAGPGVSVFPSSRPQANNDPRRRRTGPGSAHLYSNAASNKGSRVRLGELQRLCVVLHMRATDNGHLDFVYAPRDCLNGQPCMVLQTRFFRILDIGRLRQPTVSVGEVVAEVSPQAYHSGKNASPGDFVCAHEVAFDSKGKRSCNLSVWFDAAIVPCSSSKAKKMSKKDDPWRLDDSAGSLFCIPNNEEFESAFPTSNPPYVFMQPVDDLKEGHDLVRGIIEHRAASLLRSHGFRSGDGGSPVQLEGLRAEYARMRSDLGRWSWPKTSGRDHFSKTKEEQNMTMYSPSPEGASSALAVWESFVANLNDDGEEDTTPEPAPRKRLPVFRDMAKNAESDDGDRRLPRIEPARWPARTFESSCCHPLESLSESTWRELLLGEGDGSWKRTIESHIENQRKSAAARTCAHTFAS